jgi:hypothetical protein
MSFSSLVAQLGLTFVPSMVLDGNDGDLITIDNCYAVCNDFDFDSFSSELGLSKHLDAIHEEKKYGGCGFVTYKMNDSVTWYNRFSVQVVFQNGLPLCVKATGNFQ